MKIHEKRCIKYNHEKRCIFSDNANRLFTNIRVLYKHKQQQNQINQLSKEVLSMCMTKAELENKVNELRNLKAMKEELENEVKEAEREIISYMTEKGIDTEITDTAKITYKPQSRTTLDKTKLSEILGEDLKPFEKVTSYNVLRIK